MSTLHGLNDLRGFVIHASDGDIGTVDEVYFDVGSWLARRQVLLSPQALAGVNWEFRSIIASVTRDEVRASPDITSDMPVALQQQAELHKHYGWEFYWGAEALAGTDYVPVGAVPQNRGGKPFDPHLRTTRVVTGLEVEVNDGVLGKVADFLFDDDWTIRSLAVQTETMGRLLVEPQSVKRIDIEREQLLLDVSRSDVAATAG